MESSHSNEREASQILEEWRFELNRLNHELVVMVKQYMITVNGIYEKISQFENLDQENPGEYEDAITEYKDRLLLYKSWKLDEINEKRQAMFYQARKKQEQILSQSQINLPADLDLANSSLAKIAIYEGDDIVFISEQERNEKMKEDIDNIEKEFNQIFNPEDNKEN